MQRHDGEGARVIRIGGLAPLSSPGWVEAGRHLVAGLELGVRDVNDAGGIDGAPIELVVRDTAADPAKAMVAVDELAELGVVALAGEYHSVVARALAAKADALAIPYLCSSAVLDALTDKATDWVARLAPAQSRGWRIYADFLMRCGHRSIAVAVQPSIYWASGVGILRDHLVSCGGSVTEFDLSVVAPEALCDKLVNCGATALLLLVGYPEPAVSIVKSVRTERRLTGMLIGAPAGQPEFTEWETLLGGDGAAIPFLRYLPERLTLLGERVHTALRERLPEPPSFVAFEGYDAIIVLTELVRLQSKNRTAVAAWPRIELEGTRGYINFSLVPGISVWQWACSPVQVVDRDPEQLDRLRVLDSK